MNLDKKTQQLKLKIDERNCRNFFHEHFNYDIKDIKSGENSIAFQYEDSIIRFPRKKMVIEDYKKEAYVSHYITEQDKNLPIPIVNVEKVKDQIFSIHKKLDGKTMIDRLPESHDNIHFESLTAKQKNKLADDLGIFLARLHNISLEKADKNKLKSKQMGLQAEEVVGFVEKNKKLYNKLGIEYENIKFDRNDCVLSHNDFHCGNFLVDEKCSFKGAIDFGETGINYRYKDFMSLYKSLGRNFIEKVVTSYNSVSSKSIKMEELDFHYLNNMAHLYEYSQSIENVKDKKNFENCFYDSIDNYKFAKKQSLASINNKENENPKNYNEFGLFSINTR